MKYTHSFRLTLCKRGRKTGCLGTISVLSLSFEDEIKFKMGNILIWTLWFKTRYIKMATLPVLL